MAEEGGRFHNLESTNPVLPGIDFEDGLNYVIETYLPEKLEHPEKFLP